MNDTGSQKPAHKPTKKPVSFEDWLHLEMEISALFDGAPIDEEALFAGRSSEVRKILETVFARSKHVALFGERGVGKTSLSNVFWKRFHKTVRTFVVARVQAGPHELTHYRIPRQENSHDQRQHPAVQSRSSDRRN